MTRTPKNLSLGILIALMLGTVAASSASAEDTFSSDAESWTLMGSGEAHLEFGEEELTLACEDVELNEEGTPPAEGESVNQITVAPVYNKCIVPQVEVETHVEFTECAYIFTAGPTGEAHVPVHIECPEEQEIHVKLTYLGAKFSCAVIGPQTIEPGAHYDNVEIEGKGAVRVTLTAEEITYTPQGLCSGGEPTLAHNLSSLADISITGTDTAKEPINIFHTEME